MSIWKSQTRQEKWSTIAIYATLLLFWVFGAPMVGGKLVIVLGHIWAMSLGIAEYSPSTELRSGGTIGGWVVGWTPLFWYWMYRVEHKYR